MGIKTTITLVDKMSEAFNSAANAGSKAMTKIQQSTNNAASVYDKMKDSGYATAESLNAAEKAAEVCGVSFKEARDSTLEWTDAAKNMNKTWLEGMNTDEELVQMGLKVKKSMDEMEDAATGAGDGLDDYADSAEKAAEESDKLSDSTKQTGQDFDESGGTSQDAIQGLATALTTAGIIDKVKDISVAVYEMADSFSEAEKIVIASSGATGAELDELNQTVQDVYANSNAESIQEIANGMSSVSSATNLVGQELEDATQKGYELQNLFGYEMSETSRTAAALMKNFGVSSSEAYDIITVGAQNGADKNGDLLDVLNEYSAQYSALGLSANEFLSSLIEGVDQGVFSVDKVGDAVKEFNIRAKDGSDTSAEAFQILGMNADEMTAKFAAGGETARTAFYEVVNALENTEDKVQKNAAAVGLFGTQYEDLESNLLPILSNIQGGTADTTGALDTAAESAQSMSDKWKEAGNNIETAFTKNIEPSLSTISGGLADLFDKVGDFLNEHPAITKGLTAVGVGLGAAALGIAGVSAASLAAIPAIKSLGVAINASLGPIVWIASGVTAVTAVVMALSDMSSEYDELTASSQAQYDEMTKLNDEYERAKESGSATAEELGNLKYKADQATEAYENNKQTLEEWQQECEDSAQEYTDMMNSFDESQSAIDDEYYATIGLANQLSELASASDQSATSQSAMQAIIDELNGSVDGLNLTYDELINNQDVATGKIKEYAEALYQKDKFDQAVDNYMTLMEAENKYTTQLDKDKEQQKAAEEKYSKAVQKRDELVNKGYDGFWANSAAGIKDAEEELDQANEKVEQTQSQLDGTKDKMKEIEDEWSGVSDATSEATEDGVAGLENIETQLTNLETAYNDAKVAAEESFAEQFSLFDEASASTEATVANAQKALDSQLEYWNNYNSNIETLKNTSAESLGITQEQYDSIMSYVQDGSEESAGLAASMAKAVKDGDTEVVAQLAKTQEKVSNAQESAAEKVAEWTTDYKDKVQQFSDDIEKIVGDMDFGDTAYQDAKSVVDNYVEGIQNNQSKVTDAIKTMIKNAKAELEDGESTGSTGKTTKTSVEGNASGTTNSADVYIAGEEGPELIVGKKGSTVFPASETDRIIDAVGERYYPEAPETVQEVSAVYPTIEAEKVADTVGERSYPEAPKTMQELSTTNYIEKQSTNTVDKNINITLNGQGKISTDKGINADEVVSIMVANLKSTLYDMLVTEMVEEGDGSYDY